MLFNFININKNTKNNKGFTLIEILIVVMVIGILAGVMLRVINIDDVRKKTRDSQRVADLKKIQTALELYFVDTRSYPNTSDAWVSVTAGNIVYDSLISSYINQIPSDPKASTVGNYMYRSDGGSYYLTAPLELSDNFTSSPCSDSQYQGAEIGCYEVENPL